MIETKEKKKLKEFHYIINFLQNNYDEKIREYNSYSKFWNYSMKRTIKRQLDDIQLDIMKYTKLIQEYQDKWWYNE